MTCKKAYIIKKLSFNKLKCRHIIWIHVMVFKIVICFFFRISLNTLQFNIFFVENVEHDL